MPAGAAMANPIQQGLKRAKVNELTDAAESRNG